MNIKGRVKRIGQTQIVSDKFKKRDLVIETDEKYPQTIILQATQDKVNLLDFLRPGTSVDIDFNLRGREWTAPDGKVNVFNTLEIWRFNGNVENHERTQPTTPPTHRPTNQPTNQYIDNLPF